MNREFLISILQNIENAKKINRNEAAIKIIENPDLFPYLVNETFNTKNILSVKAAWVLEWICTHHGIYLLLPYLEVFVKNLHLLKFDGAIRTCAKICDQISTLYISKKDYEIQQELTSKQINTITEVCFDWLITPQKIAVKAYSMNTLYWFGLQIDWIHPELENIIRKDILQQSKGCESRGKKILLLIEKHKKTI